MPPLRWTREIHRPLSPGPIIIHRVPRKTATGPPLCGPALAAFNTIVPRAAYCRKFPLSLLFRRIMSRDLWPRVISFGLDRPLRPCAIRKLPPIYSLIFISLFLSLSLSFSRAVLKRTTNLGNMEEAKDSSSIIETGDSVILIENIFLERNIVEGSIEGQRLTFE